jgi:ketosteroid isomerase-like protein
VKRYRHFDDESQIDRHACSSLVSDTPMPGATTNPGKPIYRRTAHGLTLAKFPALALALAVSAAAVVGQAGMPRGQKHESRHEIDQLEESWRQAVMKGNTAAMSNLLADDYMAITASGTLQTKEQALESLRTGHLHFTTLDISDRKVRFYGTTALVTSVADVQGTTSEGDVSGSYRYTRVYVRNASGAWKIVSFEFNKIREPGDHGEHK